MTKENPSIRKGRKEGILAVKDELAFRRLPSLLAPRPELAPSDHLPYNLPFFTRLFS